MKKKMIFVLLAVLAVSFGSTGFTAPKKAPAKKTAKAAAKAAPAKNPLIGKWTFANRDLEARVNIEFTDEKVTFISKEPRNNSVTKYEGSYKYSPDKLTFQLIDEEKKESTVEMTYKIKGKVLKYRFAKVTGDIAGGIYQMSNPESGMLETGDMTASKVVDAPPSDKTKPENADAALPNALCGTWQFTNVGSREGERSQVVLSFTPDTATLKVFRGEGGDRRQFEGKYKFGKSPITLKMQDNLEEPITITMKYKIKGDKLTYRFTKVVGSIDDAIYKKTIKGKSVVVDMVAEKSRD